MVFSTAKLVTLALTLASSVVAFPLETRDTNVFIGYRRVHPDQAKIYNNLGTLNYDRKPIGIQLGDGVYTGQTRDGWPANPTYWYCIISAEKSKLDPVSKAWIPPKAGDKTLWHNEKNINDYIKGLDSKWDPSKTLRLGSIEGLEEEGQMVIPPALIGGKKKGDLGPMGIRAACTAPDKKPGSEKIDYGSWKNVKGSRH
ncbi:hypothetical protein BBP40_008782 [Aspergillus hancockii]|nr:hypothetical protein BBP40_008782 [Aspergillus hancockii]